MRGKSIALLVFFLSFLTESSAQAESPRWAIGVAPQFQIRQDFGQAKRSAFVPELVGFRYIGLTDRVFIRPGLRLGFGGLSQAEMPVAFQVTEHELMLLGEIGILFDGPVIPSLSVGTELIGRITNVKTREPVSSNRKGKTDLLFGGYVQIGLGVPIGASKLVVEPFARFERVIDDFRPSWRLGAEVSFAI